MNIVSADAGLSGSRRIFVKRVVGTGGTRMPLDVLPGIIILMVDWGYRWRCSVRSHADLSFVRLPRFYFSNDFSDHCTYSEYAIHVDVKNLLFLARLEFLCKTGCVPHYFQYKEVIFLFFPQNLSQTPIDHILNVCRELFCSAAPGVSCLLQRGAAVCGINFKNRSDQSGAKYRFWANQNTTR